MTEHERFKDSAAAYLLGALPAGELQAYEAHLAGCPACREEIEVLAPAAEALPASVEPMAPPPELKARIMAEVEREAALLAAAGPAADRPPAREPSPPRRRSWLPRLSGAPRLATFAATAALLVLGVAGGLGIARLAGDDAHTVAVQVDAARAPGAGAQLEVSGDGATLVARGLPAPPSGRVYQVWLKRPGHAPEPTSALFAPSTDGTATATVPGEMEGVEQVLVTDEPMGGSKVPTREPLLVATMS
jgi:anti-sigma factor RsiW